VSAAVLVRQDLVQNYVVQASNIQGVSLRVDRHGADVVVADD
jgi:hypothetical protein